MAKTEHRVALVIGNESYAAAADLKNPINDAEAVAAELESLGFDVTLGTDLGYDALRDTVRAFTRSASTADVTLFYYAGHGIAVDGENYIVPVDATLDDPFDWEFEVYSVSEILRLVGRSAGPSLIFLDACRDNPLASVLAQAQGMSTRSVSNRGLQRIPAESVGTSGSVIAYATEPGQVAADGDGENSPFTEALLTHLSTENMDFASVASLIRGEVMEKTNGVQRPRFDFALNGPLILNAVATPEVVPMAEAAVDTTPSVTVAPADNSAALDVQKLMFETAVASNDVADYEAFLSTFPDSPFAPMAENAINRLTVEQKEPEQFASLETGSAQRAQPSASRLISAPLALQVTDAARRSVSSQATEQAMSLDLAQRKAVQIRLNMAGQNVGSADGSIGPKSRRGITAWQTFNGFAPTGYLNVVQHQFLVASTEQPFQQYLAANPNALS
ncbi:MAG: caspase family protein, partial [Roseobacter sp.]|nr:caspase family protein [Roseobacter sp.]